MRTAVELNMDVWCYCPPQEEYWDYAVELVEDQLIPVLRELNAQKLILAQLEDDPFGAF